MELGHSVSACGKATGKKLIIKPVFIEMRVCVYVSERETERGCVCVCAVGCRFS